MGVYYLSDRKGVCSKILTDFKKRLSYDLAKESRVDGTGLPFLFCVLKVIYKCMSNPSGFAENLNGIFPALTLILATGIVFGATNFGLAPWFK